MIRASNSASRRLQGGTFRPQLEALEARLTPSAPSDLCGLVAPPVLGAALAAGQQNGAIVTTSPVVLESNNSVIVGESTLIRTENGLTARLSASGLEPGVYTFWMRVDMAGGTVAGRIAGHVVGQSGILNVTAHVSVGEVLSGHPLLPSGALEDPQHAKITLVVRKHGPADPGRIHEQTTTFEPTMAVNFLRSTHLPPP